MASVPAYTKVVAIKTTASTAWLNLPLTTVSFSLGADMLDDTTILSTGYKSRVAGLKDYSLTGDLVYNTSNTAFAAMKSAVLSGATLDVKYLPDGSHGYQGQVKVQSFNESGDVTALEKVSITLQATGSALSTA